MPLQGTPKGTPFSDKAMVATRIDKELVIYGYTECSDVIGDLMSFTLILADSINQNRTKLKRAGPDVGKCPGFTFPSSRVYKAAIYADESRVYGIRLLSVIGVSDIGSLRGTPVLFEFGSSQLPIGFYGTYTDAGVTSLGFLTHDPNCVRYVPP